VALCQKVREQAERFDGASSSGTIASARANEIIKQVTRVLNTVLYTTRDRFHQDPAVLEEMLPGLAVAKLLSSADPDKADFARCQVVKQANRVIDALRRASKLLEDAWTRAS
jgi:hypothetical protein